MTATAPEAPPIPTTSSGARPRVLVADDSRVIRTAVKKILESDFDVVLAESGDAAWGFLVREPNFHLLVTDIEMPGIDGYELICRVRGADQPALRDLPVLTITGAEDEQTKERAFACGATDFITKPIDAIQLKARAQSYTRLDQSARELAERATQLEDQAINDPLTGLRSRRFFLQRGAQELAQCARNQQDLTVVRLDIDRYKEIYRKYGDDVGDRILTWLASIVSSNARLEDTVARVAGAKFAILASMCDLEEARQLCERLRKAVRDKPFMNQGEVVELTLSFGLACFAQERAEHIEPLLNLADERVNRAMFEGGDRICVSVLGDVTPSIEEVVLDVPPAEVPADDAKLQVVDKPAVTEQPTLGEELGELEIPDLTPELGASEVTLEPTSSEPPPVDEPGELEVPSLEMPSIEETPPALDAAPAPIGESMSAELISVDKALQLIASGQGKQLEPYLASLIDQLKPLLDLIARNKQE